MDTEFKQPSEFTPEELAAMPKLTIYFFREAKACFHLVDGAFPILFAAPCIARLHEDLEHDIKKLCHDTLITNPDATGTDIAIAASELTIDKMEQNN